MHAQNSPNFILTNIKIFILYIFFVNGCFSVNNCNLFKYSYIVLNTLFLKLYSVFNHLRISLRVNILTLTPLLYDAIPYRRHLEFIMCRYSEG